MKPTEFKNEIIAELDIDYQLAWLWLFMEKLRTNGNFWKR